MLFYSCNLLTDESDNSSTLTVQMIIEDVCKGCDFFSECITRSSLINASGETRTPAYHLMPQILMNDGLTGLDSYTEKTVTETDTILGSTVISDFDIMYNQIDDNIHQAIAEVLETRWESLSAISHISLTERSWNDFLSNSDTLNFDVRRGGWYLDSNNILVYYKTLIGNSGYSDSALSTLISDAEQALEDKDITQHTAKLKAIHNHLIAAAVLVPVYYLE